MCGMGSICAHKVHVHVENICILLPVARLGVYFKYHNNNELSVTTEHADNGLIS